MVGEGVEIPEGVLAAGIPARVKKELAGASQRWVETAAREYQAKRPALHALAAVVLVAALAAVVLLLLAVSPAPPPSSSSAYGPSLAVTSAIVTATIAIATMIEPVSCISPPPRGSRV